MISILIAAFTYLQMTYVTQDYSKCHPPKASNIVFKSSDGKKWEDVSSGLPADLKLYTLAVADEKVFIGAEKSMYRLNMDDQSGWQKELFLKNHFVKVQPGKGGAYGLHYEDGILQRMPPTGFWLPIYTSFDVKSIITVLEIKENIVLIGCDSGIFKSSDGGLSWKQVYNRDFVVTFIEKNGDVLAESKNSLLKSADQGETWQVVLTGDGMPLKTVVHQGSIITVNRVNNNRKNVSSDLHATSSKFRISDDNGKNWNTIDVSAFPGQLVYDLETCGAYLYISTYSGIFRSGDKGKTWKLVLKDTDAELFKFASTGKVIYAAKEIGGC